MTITHRSINGRKINPIGYGCMTLSWAYGQPPEETEAAKVLHQALDLGYDHFDTANIYGLGHNETLIGNTLRQNRSKFFLASKMGLVVDGALRGIDCSPQAIHKCIDETLKRLQTDHIDLYYMHRFDPKVPIADSMGAMAELVTAGKIGAIGVSEWSASHVREAHALHPLAAVQTEYSPWTRNPELGVLETCRELGITFVAFSPVARGALADAKFDPSAIPEKDIRRALPRFLPDHWPNNQKLILQFAGMALRESVTPAQLSLAWLLSRGDHVVAIPGTTNPAHLQENIARWDWEIPQDVVAEIDRLINQQTVSGHRYPEIMRHTIDTEDFN